MMRNAYALKERIQRLVFSPNLSGWHEFCDHIVVQQDFRNRESTEKLWIFDAIGRAKQICYDHQ